MKNKARATKRDFFSSYGIEYKAGKILAPWGQWVPLPLTWGSKTHCYGWSTLAGTKTWKVEFNGQAAEMKGTCICQCEHCYGCAGRYAMPGVYNANAWRTFAARFFQDWLKRAIVAQINYGKRGRAYEAVRVHITGDFFSAAYIQMWKDIKAMCPDTRMWSYTKNPEAENAFDNVAGFNVVKSAIPGHGFNYGHCDHVIKVYNALRAASIDVHICRCGVDKDQHCDTCKACQELQYVLFLEHGSDYKPGKDPLFNQFKAIVESDENRRHI